jgi:hypothetical protein
MVESRIIPNDRFHNVFQLREADTGELLLDDLELHFVRVVLPATRAEMLDKKGAMHLYTSNFVSNWAGEVPA